MNKILITILMSTLFLSACESETGNVQDEEIQGSTSDIDDSDSEEDNNNDSEELPEEIQDLTLTDVRGDVTGEWKKVVTTSNVNMPENAVSYSEEYMEGSGVHYIISFATNTTTMINDTGDTLYVDITEYVDGEEHSADTLGTGMLLGSYAVNLDDGEITELE